MVTQLPDEDQVSLTKKQLLARLNVLMGGKAAEELIEGVEEVSTGASNDLEQATNLARAMVTRYGMSTRVGQLSIPYNSVLSPETRAEVEKEVRGGVGEGLGWGGCWRVLQGVRVHVRVRGREREALSIDRVLV